jgi:uncharacterized OB-fold protein
VTTVKPTTVKPPIPDRDDAFFWEGTRNEKLLIQRCGECGTLRHPPAPMCARCGSLDLDTVESTGRGTVHSWIVSHHPTEPDAEPRVVILVDLEEGTRLVSNLIDAALDEVHNGMAVDLCFVDHGEVVLPQFLPAGRQGATR